MIQKIIHKLLKARHPWRELSFSQLAELYSAVTLRQMAQSLVGLFIPVFLYESGYLLPDIMLFFVIAFSISLITCVPIGYLVARVGPKHVLLLSNLAQIVVLAFLVTLSDRHWSLFLPASLYGLSLSLYFVPYHVDFSKILHPDHGGKELGFMINLGKATGIIGPVIGGVVASCFGARYTLLAGMVLSALAAVPLFASGEPVSKHQHLNFKGLWRRELWRDYLTLASYAGQQKAGLILWPLFIAVTIFSTQTYAKLGVIISIGTAASMLSTAAIGRIVDNKRGGELMRFGTIADTIIHLLRATATGFGGALTVTLADQVAISGAGIPCTRGYYDRADSLKGQRIAYVCMMQVASNVGNLALMLAGYGLSLFLMPGLALKAVFMVAAGMSLLMLAQRFPALAPSHRRLPFRLLASPFAR